MQSKAITIDAEYQQFNGTHSFMLEKSSMSITLQHREVLIHVELATICGSDIHTFEGKRKEPTPCILGHEAIGKIVGINGRNEFSIGDRVTWSVADSCGECEFCLDYNLPEKCKSLFKYGHASVFDQTGLNGCYSNYIILRAGTHLVKVPDNIPDTVAAPANCALATMVNAVSKIDEPSKSIVIQGGGLLGIYGIGLLKSMGVKRVYCVELNVDRFELINQFGGIPVDGRDLQNATDEILRNDPLIDAVIEVAGNKKVISQAIDLLRPGGKYILVGLVHPDSLMDLKAETIIRKCMTMVGVHNYSPGHLTSAVKFLEDQLSDLPFERLVSPVFKLSQLKEAFEEAGKNNWCRIAVKP